MSFESAAKLSSEVKERAPSRVRTFAVLALLAAGTTIVVARTGEAHDDPWILYRYAENLAHGYGWTFNPGQAGANAVTSPLTVLLLAVAIAVHIPVAWASTILFAVGTWTAAVCSYLALRRGGHELAGAIAALLIVVAPPLYDQRGMETALYLALCVGGIYAASCGRSYTAGVVLGSAVLARPDAALVGVVVACWMIWRERQVPWRLAAGAVVPLGPWLAVAVPLTGTLLPSTLAAKVAQAASGQWSGYLATLLRTPLQPGMGSWFALALPLGAVGAVAAVWRRIEVLAPLAVATTLLVLAYGVVLQVAGYAWYCALPVLLLTWLAGAGAELILDVIPDQRGRAMAACVLVAAAMSALVAPAGMLPMRQQYEQVGAWLQVSSPAGATVAAEEIGRLGFFSDRTMVDYLGLLDPAAVPHVRAREWAWWVAEKHPDFWVAIDEDWGPENTVRADPVFQAAYVPVWRTADLVVYQRR